MKGELAVSFERKGSCSQDGADMQGVEELKTVAAQAALRYVRAGEVIGVGSGSTAEEFIRLLCEGGLEIAAAIPSSERTAELLRKGGLRVLSLNDAGAPRLYVDGADEVDAELRLIKGGGGALAREKILATAAETFVCIADESKLVGRLGRFPLPVEVLPFAREVVARDLRRMGGEPRAREGVATDNGNQILDVVGLAMDDPAQLEGILDADATGAESAIGAIEQVLARRVMQVDRVLVREHELHAPKGIGRPRPLHQRVWKSPWRNLRPVH